MWILAVFSSLVVLAAARPEPPVSGYGGSASGLDSYAAPIGGSGSGGYPAPAPKYGVPNQQPIVQKHIYVHVPPPEAPTYKPKKYYPQPIPQKHYKIVFIKAPTPPTPTVPDLPPIAPPDEEKTLIYVLVKKPEDQPEIRIPTPAPTQPSRPEVYFIRYKSQQNVISQDGGYAEAGGYPSGRPDTKYGAPSGPSAPSAPSGSYGVPSGSQGY